MKTIYTFLFLGLAWSNMIFAQETGIEEIVIHPKNASVCDLQLNIGSDRIESKLATDVGQLLLLFPGVQLKNYGGLGGLKTVGFRNLGAGHTSIVQDNTAYSVTQSGQTDLSQIPIDFIQNISLISVSSTDVNLPIQSKLAGSIVSLTSRHTFNPKDTTLGTIGLQAGSFGQYNAHLFLGHNWKKWRISLSGKSRIADGAYPFTYKNGNTLEKRIRKNADLVDHYGTFSVHFIPNSKNKLSFFANGNSYNKGLPGAVVFYNETADQRINGNQLISGIRHEYTLSRLSISTAINAQHQYLKYTDSSYLNTQGYLIQRFQSLQLDAQTQVKYEWKKIAVLAGIEVRNETMDSPNLIKIVKRVSNEGVLGANLRYFGNTSLQLGFQQISDERTLKSYESFNLLPAVDWNLNLSKTLSIGLGYRYTVRQPTFSELYYQQIGNSDLKAEKAQIANIRFGHAINLKKWFFSTLIQPYYTQVENKILAIPTKNLFIWSIQNIGKTSAFGTELTHKTKRLFKHSSLSLSLNYTFQYAIDLTDPSATTYRNLLSYSPLNSGTAELSFTRKHWSCFGLMTYQGARYALNENIDANLLDPYSIFDLGGSYRFDLKKAQSIRIQATVNNITNVYYSYIRYFIMPGIHFNIQLTYAF